MFESERFIEWPHRIQDLADVMNLIRVNQLSLSFASTLNPYVHGSFCELWQTAQVEEDY